MITDFKAGMPREALLRLLRDDSPGTLGELQARAAAVRDAAYGPRVFFRGLIELSNHCKNDCYYCGIRRGNRGVDRYRLTDDEVMTSCAAGYALGFRTFVIQSGEDPYFTQGRTCGIIKNIRTKWPDVVVSLSLGERPYEDFKAFREAGADRYLLRHETANERHYDMLHPREMKFETRKKCLYELKSLGFQTGAGFMAGSPGQTPETIADDFEFMTELQPEMIGIGPFIPARGTPFANKAPGTLEGTLKTIAIARILFPDALIPSTTALGTIAPNGRELGLLSGANVVMPNLTPMKYREAYTLYDNKLISGEEDGAGLNELRKRVEAVGLELYSGRGDFRNWRNDNE